MENQNQENTLWQANYYFRTKTLATKKLKEFETLGVKPNHTNRKVKPYLTKGKFSKLIIKLVLNIRDDKFSKLEFETLDEIFEDLIEDKLKKLAISGKLPDILVSFKTTGKMYYKSIYDKFIKNAYSVLINYNRFILNQYKYIRTIKEINDITDRSR